MEQITKNSEIIELTEKELIETNGGLSISILAGIVCAVTKNQPPRKPIPKD
ncbi:MAG: hypothetical protein MJ211_11140 [Bacteroidales bacterium]|nr:hypothetical protein [Bacteroidales bacterium]